jgi:thioredoxin reductase
MKKQPKIEVINNINVTEIKGTQEKGVTHVILDNEYKGNKELKLDGLFIAIGHIPLSEVAKKAGVKINKKGEIMINRKAETNIDGFFAAGDVVDTHFKQAITGVAEGVLAAYGAYEYVNGREIKEK